MKMRLGFSPKSISVPLIGLLESVSLNMTGSLRDDVDRGVPLQDQHKRRPNQCSEGQKAGEATITK